MTFLCDRGFLVCSIACICIVACAAAVQAQSPAPFDADAARAASASTLLARDLFGGRIDNLKRAFAQPAAARLGRSFHDAVDSARGDLGEVRSTGVPVMSRIATSELFLQPVCRDSSPFGRDLRKKKLKSSDNAKPALLRMLVSGQELLDIEYEPAERAYIWGAVRTAPLITLTKEGERVAERYRITDARELKLFSEQAIDDATFVASNRFASRFPRPNVPDDPSLHCGLWKRIATRESFHTIASLPVEFERGTIEVDFDFDAAGSLVAILFGSDAARTAAHEWDRDHYAGNRTDRAEAAFRDRFSSLQKDVDGALVRLPAIETAYGKAYREDDATAFVNDIVAKTRALANSATTHPAARAYINKELDAVVTAPPVLQTTLPNAPAQHVNVVEPPALVKVAEAILRPFRALMSASDLSPDLTFVSDVDSARVTLHVGTDSASRRVVYTSNTLPNVWRGRYDGLVQRDGFKDGTFELDIVDETRTTVQCMLIRLNDEGKSFCQFIGDQAR